MASPGPPQHATDALTLLQPNIHAPQPSWPSVEPPSHPNPIDNPSYPSNYRWGVLSSSRSSSPLQYYVILYCMEFMAPIMLRMDEMSSSNLCSKMVPQTSAVLLMAIPCLPPSSLETLSDDGTLLHGHFPKACILLLLPMVTMIFKTLTPNHGTLH